MALLCPSCGAAFDDPLSVLGALSRGDRLRELAQACRGQGDARLVLDDQQWLDGLASVLEAALEG